MEVTPTDLPEVLLIRPRIHADDRGFFLETYNEQRYAEAGIHTRFVQDNHSKSAQGVLRGLHYQIEHPQAKLVWVVAGQIWDVAVDVRPGSRTFGRWAAATLDAVSKHQFFVPEGFAHGFCVLSETAEVIYKCSDVYRPSDEGGVVFDDPELAIEWPITDPILSAKDRNLPLLSRAELPLR